MKVLVRICKEVIDFLLDGLNSDQNNSRQHNQITNQTVTIIIYISRVANKVVIIVLSVN